MRLSIRGYVAYILLHIFWMFPIKKGKILFKSYNGNYINDNSASVYKSLLRKGYKGDLVWSYMGANADPAIKTVRPISIREIFELATSNCWVDNKRKPYWLRKRKGQFYVQLWHGDIPLKKIEKDAEDKLDQYYISEAQNDSRMIDVLVSGSRFMTQIYNDSFWYRGRIFECGVPRSDVFFRGNYQEITNRVKEYYGLKPKIKIILYAPTFREKKDTDAFDLDVARLIRLCGRKIGGDWIALLRMHPNIAEKAKNLTYSEEVLNGTLYPDSNELIIASDIIITDYSSLMFDGMLAGKKVLLYVKDCEQYQDERGYYFSLDELPFPKVYSNDDLDNALDYVYSSQYYHGMAEFEDELGIIKNDSASDEVADLIMKQMGNV